jgi:hypothetical protein
LRDPGLRRRALEGADVVVHIAALHAPHVGQVPDAQLVCQRRGDRDPAG